MPAQTIAPLFKPTITSLGYGLFQAVNAAGVWGGVFPFLPLEFQTPRVVLWFFLAQSLVFSLSYFASALGVYFFPKPTRSFAVRLVCAPYLLGWVSLIGAIYISPFNIALVIAGGALLGLGSAGFYMLWQRLFASADSDTGNLDLIKGTALGSLIYFSLYLIPQAVTAFLIPLVFLPLFGLTIVLKSREIDLDQAMFKDVPREHPRVYRRIIALYGRSALCIGALGFCAGVMRSFAIDEVSMGLIVNVMSMGSVLVGALVMLILWQFKNLRLNVVGIYRIVFPFTITAFLLLPLLAHPYVTYLAAILHAIYSVAVVIVMIQCAQASRDYGINPVFIYGFLGGVVSVLHDVGFASAIIPPQIILFGTNPLVIISLVALYLLGLMYFVGQGGFKRIFRFEGSLLHDEERTRIELIARRTSPSSQTGQKPLALQSPTGTDTPYAHALNPLQTPLVPASPPKRKTSQTETTPLAHGVSGSAYEPLYQDRLSKQAEALRQHYRLTAREAEVMELIARGHTVARIAEDLVVSENTIRTHSKRIYTKLAIHKRQELLDLIDQFNPRDLKD